jgi:hypothetical protein
MRRTHLLAICALLALLLPPGTGARAASVTIHLRRASFDPLRQTPAAVATASSSTLRLAQLSGPPNAERLAALRSAGLEPLVYIPDNTYLVRTSADSAPQLAGLRWQGALPASYKLSADLADLLDAGGGGDVELRVVATPDADLAGLRSAIAAAGGAVSGQRDRLNGASLSARLPADALQRMAARDDVVWLEQRIVPKLLNDSSRALTGVDAARAELSWLTGVGQIVAVTDSGLDRSDTLSADFSGRVAASFTPQQMDSSCSTATWSDYNGHGTHVSGSILGSGANSPSGLSFAGVAPRAQVVVQAVASQNSGGSLDCLTDDDSFLQKAYDAGARVQNASWGSPTGQSRTPPFRYSYGGYDDFAATVDDFLYRHPEHLLVAAAGNAGEDADGDGVIDADSLSTPATAKNGLAVGASENNRPPSASGCGSSAASPLSLCWASYLDGIGAPIADDFVSDDPGGLAAFSSRGPTDDGRIKPEIVAPGTNVVSARSHASGASYSSVYNDNYAYESGTSMATPMVSGAAALVRQWLSHERGLSAPSAALVKALLLNGASDLSPGQYGTGATREIPTAWPNSVQGWGRLSLDRSVELSGASVWLRDPADGLETGGKAEYQISVAANTPRLRVTLSWTDYPATPLASKALVNDLDLELVAPDGTVLHGNADADLGACREDGADRCDTNESIDISSPQAGSYTLRVAAHSVAHGPQRFALAARAAGSGNASTPEPSGKYKRYFPLVSTAQ